MYIRQKGCLPTFVNVIGTILIGYFIIASIIYSVNKAISLSSLYPINEALGRTIVIFLILIFIVSLIPILFGMFLLTMFPRIKIIDTGISYKYLYFFNKTIAWKEISSIIELKFPKGYSALILSRNGFFLLNGLFLNWLYGVLFRLYKPILLISGGLEDKDEFIGQIKNHMF
jgi:hypothetical protein